MRYKYKTFVGIKSCKNDIPFFINQDNLVQK